MFRNFRNSELTRWLNESSSSSSSSSSDDSSLGECRGESLSNVAVRKLKRNLMNDSDSSSGSSQSAEKLLDQDDEFSQSTRKGLPRARKRESWPCYRGSNGELIPLQPKQSTWWLQYIDNPPV